MKILIINTFYKPYNLGGAERVCEYMVNGFINEGNEVSVLTTCNKKEAIKTEMIDFANVIRLPIKNIYWPYNKKQPPSFKRFVWHTIDVYNPFMARAVEKVLIKEKPDVAVCHNLTGFSASIWKVLKKNNIPMIQVLHDLYSICPKSNMFNGMDACKKRCFKCSFFRFVHPYLSSDVDAVVGVSRFVLDKHLDYGLFKNAKVKTFIHNALIEQLPKIRKNVGFEKLTFGFIGSLTPNKGIENLLKIFNKIDLKHTELLIAGIGKEDYENYLKNKYTKDNIKFLGYQKRDEFFNQIDVLIVPSLWNDTLPTVILESFIYGIPVIASKRGGIPELVNDDNGWLFEPTDLKNLEKLLKDIISNRDKIDSKKDYIISTRDKYTDYNNWISKYMEVINEIIKKR
ncbi:MAG: glycosyltransferase family 4 protein [Elusimicrobia bacterium]|nr:glycosyltransferase family 4 protein [Elusimicrobiota bacterium]